MSSKISSFVRLGVVALAALACLDTAAIAAPLRLSVEPAVADGSTGKPILVEMGEGRDHGPGYRVWPRRGNWNGGGRHWNGGGRHWNGRHWNDGWRGGRHWRRGGWGPGVALGLGLGLPLGYYGGGYYDNYYDGYYEPVYRPVYRPRVYRERAYGNYRRNNEYRRYESEDSRTHCDNVYLTGPRFFRCDR